MTKPRIPNTTASMRLRLLPLLLLAPEVYHHTARWAQSILSKKNWKKKLRGATCMCLDLNALSITHTHTRPANKSHAFNCSAHCRWTTRAMNSHQTADCTGQWSQPDQTSKCRTPHKKVTSARYPSCCADNSYTATKAQIERLQYFPANSNVYMFIVSARAKNVGFALQAALCGRAPTCGKR